MYLTVRPTWTSLDWTCKVEKKSQRKGFSKIFMMFSVFM